MWWERLEQLREDRGWTVVELARRSGVSKDALHKYLRGDVDQPRAGIVAKLADVFGVTELWLRYGDTIATSTLRLTKDWQGLPLCSLRDIGERGLAVSVRDAIEHVAMPDNISPQAIAVRASDNSMAPNVVLGDILVCDPSIPYSPGDIVVATVRGLRDAIIRRYRPLKATGNKAELRADNPDFPAISVVVGQNCRVIGRCVKRFHDL